MAGDVMEGTMTKDEARVIQLVRQADAERPVRAERETDRQMRAWWDEGISITEIASRLGVSVATVRRIVGALHLPERPRGLVAAANRAKAAAASQQYEPLEVRIARLAEVLGVLRDELVKLGARVTALERGRESENFTQSPDWPDPGS
jgi:transposase